MEKRRRGDGKTGPGERRLSARGRAAAAAENQPHALGPARARPLPGAHGAGIEGRETRGPAETPRPTLLGISSSLTPACSKI